MDEVTIMKKKKLNLGCGEFKKEGFTNVDWVDFLKPDVVHNLQEFPYPFEDNSFNHIESDHLLEHLEDPFAVMREIHRIGKSGATVSIRVPHFSRAMTHPEHKRGFDVSFPYYFDPTFLGGYQGAEFSIENIQLTWFAQKYLKKKTLSSFMYYSGVIIGAPLTFIANLSPVFCSRIWCFWFGGFEEIKFDFVIKK